MVHQIDPKKIEQCGEINDIQWFTESVCLEHLRRNKKSKKELIRRVFQFLRGHESANK